MPDTAAPYLHGHHESVLRSHRWRTAENSAGYLLPFLESAGSGSRCRMRAGHDHGRVGEPRQRGHVLGIDASRGRRGPSEARGGGTRRSDNVSSRSVTCSTSVSATGPSTWSMPIRCSSTWRIRSRRLIEMRRVCRPGGIVAARDGDYRAMFWFPDDPESRGVAGALPACRNRCRRRARRRGAS